MSKCKCTIDEGRDFHDRPSGYTSIKYCTLHKIAEELFNAVELYIKEHENYAPSLQTIIRIINQVETEKSFI